VSKGKANRLQPWTRAKDARQERHLADSKALITRRASAIGGNGLFAAQRIKKAQLICPLDGTRKPHEEVKAAPSDHWWHQYAIGSSDDGWSVIPDLDSVGWHLANHSCNPNSIVDVKRDNYLVARRDIQPGQEITFDYGWERFEPMPCHCGEEHCSGNIGLYHPEGNFDPFHVATMMRTAYRYDNEIPFKRFFHAFKGQLDRPQLETLFELAFGPEKDQAIEWMFREGVLSDPRKR
jgi:hypothetical protein